ncbi:hypothetical protein NXY48_16930 [Bacteroides ovatus]|nr:hypothetical protein [Bacteroides ovatus]
MKISYAFPWVKGLKASLGLVYDTSYSEDNGFLVGYNVNAYSADSKSYNLMRASSTSEKGNYTKSASSFRRFMVRPSVGMLIPLASMQFQPYSYMNRHN